MAGYSGTPLPKKLGIKQHFRVALLELPGDVKAELKSALANCNVGKDGPLDFAMIFVKSAEELKKLMDIRCPVHGFRDLGHLRWLPSGLPLRPDDQNLCSCPPCPVR